MEKQFNSKTGSFLLLLHFCLHCFVSVHCVSPNERMCFIPGDLYLLGFFPIHEFDSVKVCGQILEEGLQQLEAFLFSIKKINENKSILPNVTLGVIGIDSCDSHSHVLKRVMDNLNELLLSNTGFRETLNCSNGLHPYTGTIQRIVGVIGGRSSSVSIQLASLLRVFKIPQVSYKSTASTLSNKNLYEYFFRTVPPVSYQAKVLLEIIKELNWTYISVVYSDSTYGDAGLQSLQEFVAKTNICFAAQQRVDVKTFKDNDYDAVLEALMKERATGVVVFGEQILARNIMAASTRKGVLDRFVWLGSEAWGSRDYAVKGFEAVAEGTLCVAYHIEPPPGFFEYFRALTPEKTKTNPWFGEFWEKKKNCTLNSNFTRPLNFSRKCSGNISEEQYMQTMPSSHLVRNAVYSMAKALDDMYKEKCRRNPEHCSKMKTVNGEELKKYLSKVKFDDVNGEFFQFDSKGDAPPRYTIANYQKDEGSDKYSWKTVGTYKKNKHSPVTLQLDRSIMKFKHHRPEYPNSTCSVSCLPGQGKVVSKSNGCCWKCFICTDYQYISKEHGCSDCQNGYISNKNKSTCEEIPETSMNYRNPWAIGCITFAVFGILASGGVSVAFWLYRDTPIIKASAKELCTLLLLGIFLSYLLTFVIVSPPRRTTCAAIRFCLGLCYTVIYSAIVVKTSLIARIFGLRGDSQKPKYTSPQSQLIIAAGLISLEAIINTTWLMCDVSETAHQFPSRADNILVCKGLDTSSYMVGLVYPFLLMMISMVYAFKTRNCPDGFNEARHITFANFVTLVIWMVFMTTFVYRNEYDVRPAMMSLLLSLSATTQLACLFVPKMYVAILQPENNTKDIVMGCATFTTPSGGQTPST